MRALMIVALDFDGIINPSPLAKVASNNYVSGTLEQLPGLKRVILEIVEFSEALLDVRYKANDGMEVNMFLMNDAIPFKGIITDRSLVGLERALGEDRSILERMNFIQVRHKPSTAQAKRRYQSEIWETKDLKPSERVLYRLATFAKEEKAEPDQVMVVDDDPRFRFMARNRFHFRTYPEDVEEVRTLEHSGIAQHTMAPA
ncbi:MAG: hypothetical protein M1361_01275 [Patescibacteria group bacterium]|nr:hypothetical protein [Patescibacteria group bacterium]MCL5224233.1 hypothetical protein [Patescibacteria group bacterium]